MNSKYNVLLGIISFILLVVSIFQYFYNQNVIIMVIFLVLGILTLIQIKYFKELHLMTLMIFIIYQLYALVANLNDIPSYLTIIAFVPYIFLGISTVTAFILLQISKKRFPNFVAVLGQFPLLIFSFVLNMMSTILINRGNTFDLVLINALVLILLYVSFGISHINILKHPGFLIQKKRYEVMKKMEQLRYLYFSKAITQEEFYKRSIELQKEII